MRPLLALFIRTLREDVRSKSTYLLRAGLVTMVLYFLWTTHIQSRWVGAVGRNFFGTILWIDLFILAVAGLSYFSSAIAEEKEDGTLGLLRMTDLNALAILLGKSTGRLVGVLLLGLAQIPFTLLAITMGGVGLNQIFAGYGALLAFAFFAANLGLLASVLCRRTAGAALLTALTLAVFVFGPWVLGLLHARALLRWSTVGSLPFSEFLAAWQHLTPIHRLREVLGTGFGGPLWSEQMVASLALGALCFLASWAFFEPATRASLGSADTTSRKRARKSGARRTDGLGTGAIGHREFRAAGGSRTVTILSLLAAGIVFFSGWIVSDSSGAFRTEDFIGPLLGFGIPFVLLTTCLEAGRIFSTERQQKTLGSLSGLPISAAQLARAKTWGRLKAIWPAAMPALAGLGLIPALIPWSRPRMDSNMIYPLLMMVETAFFMVGLPIFIAWMSLRIRRGSFAIGITVWVLGHMVITPVLAIIFQGVSIVLLPLITLGLLLGFVGQIPARLEALAADE